MKQYIKKIILKILKDNNSEYIKHTRVRFKEGSQKQITEIFKEFFENINGAVIGLKGYAILENVENDRESVVLTFWEIEQIWKNTILKITIFYLI
jgi:heme-degrading monooxygenase HmoA